MRIRPYLHKDYEKISKWITDERAHALWCANLLPYPLEQSSFENFLLEISNRFNDSAFVATTDDGDVVGFFVFSVNLSINEGMLKFVVVDDSIRGMGYGTEMINLAVKYAFYIEKANAVQLNVFSDNVRALKCYQKAGFIERTHTDNAFPFGEECWGRINMIRQA